MKDLLDSAIFSQSQNNSEMPKLELTGKFAKLTIIVCTPVWDFGLTRAGGGGGLSWVVGDSPPLPALSAFLAHKLQHSVKVGMTIW